MNNKIDKSSYISDNTVLGSNIVIYPNVYIEGNVVIGDNVIIYPNTFIKDTTIGDNTIIISSHIYASKIGDSCKIGPYSYIHDNVTIENNINIGAFVELKTSVINSKSKIKHLSYIGNTEIGNNVNIGAGVITANYDGVNKNKTIIKDNAFIGVNTNLIAPITIEENSLVAAGSTITKDVPRSSLAIERNKQKNKKNYYSKNKV